VSFCVDGQGSTDYDFSWDIDGLTAVGALVFDRCTFVVRPDKLATG